MFIYDKIPSTTLEKVAPKTPIKVFKRMPQNLADFCNSIETDDYFWGHHSNLHISTKTIRDFYAEILSFLEANDAIEYSIFDTLQMAGIPAPLAITFSGRYEHNLKPNFNVDDLSNLFMLKTGKLWLAPHHQTRFESTGKVPEVVASILRDYVKYILKCKDKNFEELQTELTVLENAKIIDETLYNEIIESLSTQTKTQPQKQ